MKKEVGRVAGRKKLERNILKISDQKLTTQRKRGRDLCITSS